MALFDLTLPNLLAYALMAWLLFCAIAHAFAARELRRALGRAEREFDEAWAGGRGPGPEELKIRHPSARVLEQVSREPKTARDDLAVAAWVSCAVDDCLGSLRTRMERVRSAAPVLGITGTIAGFLIAAWTFGETQDSARLMASTALALVTTLLGGVVTLIERWVLEGTIDPLEARLMLHGEITAARARTLLEPRDVGRHSPREKGNGFEEGFHDAANAEAAAAE